MADNDILKKIVEVSKGMTIKYELVTFRGVPVLINIEKLKHLISYTWERNHDPELEKIAKEFGITLRKFR